MKGLWFLSLSVAILYLGCAERDMPTDAGAQGAPVIEKVDCPQFLNPNRTYAIGVRVSDTDGARDIAAVTGMIYRQGSETPELSFDLYDDGGYLHPEDGDVVAFDGYFSAKILWSFYSNQQETYRFVFQAVDHTEQQSERVDVQAVSARRLPPEILAVYMPQTLESGFEGTRLLAADVADSSGLDDVRFVGVEFKKAETLHYTLELYDDGQLGDQNAGDGRFSRSIDRSFAAGLSGSYQAHFSALDRSDAGSPVWTESILIENEPPVLLELAAPDTIDRPPHGEFVDYLVSLHVHDPQSLVDIKTVRMEYIKPDGSYASSGRYFELYDNGRPFDLSRWNDGYRGDEVEGDGLFSTIIRFGAPVDQPQPLLGDYSLKFEAIDWVDQKSEFLAHKIILK